MYKQRRFCKVLCVQRGGDGGQMPQGHVGQERDLMSRRLCRCRARAQDAKLNRAISHFMCKGVISKRSVLGQSLCAPSNAENAISVRR